MTGYLWKNSLLVVSCLILTFFQCKRTNSDTTELGRMITVQATVPDSSQLSFIRNDSLKKLLEVTEQPRKKIHIYRQLCLAYVWSWPDSAIEYATKGLEMATELKIETSQLDFLSYLTAAYSQNGNFPIALEKAFLALDVAKTQSNPFFIASCLADIGSVYFYSGDYENALIYFRQTQENPEVFKVGEELYTTFIGETYFHLNQLDSARLYLNKAYDMEIKSASHWNVPYLYMGKLVEKEGKYREALRFYRAGIKEKVPEADYIKTYLAIADVFDKTSQLDSGIYYARLAYSLAKNTSLYIFTFEAAFLLSKLYRADNNIDNAFYYQDLMLAEKDRIFSREKMAELQNLAYAEQKKMDTFQQDRLKQRNRIIFFTLAMILIIFSIIMFILYRANKFRKKAYRLLEKQKAEIDTQKSRLENTLHSLKATQSQLIQSEKMASLGELTAGIAHEIQNPLNFVNNFAEVSNELLDELNEELDQGNREEIKQIAGHLKNNLAKIFQHGERASSIVRSMLLHSRSIATEKELTDINALCDEYLRISYHGMLAKNKAFNAKYQLDLDENLPEINIVPQDLGRVLLNLVNNAFYAVEQKAKDNVSGYEPLVTIHTQRKSDSIEIRIADNGTGVPEALKNKIFQPFFTTKPAGQGTGLGLSLSFDIIQGYDGTLRVEGTEGKGSQFLIKLPIS